MEETKNKENICRRLLASSSIRKIDEDARTMEFVASDNSVDSYHTVLPVDKWDLTRYEKNGAVGYMHDVYGDSWTKAADPDDIIGKGEAFVEDNQLIVRITFEPADLNEKADKIFRKLQFGSLNGVSVGFSPIGSGHWGDETRGEEKDVYYYGGQELLEVSVVNIPSNKNAIKRFYGDEMELREAEKVAEVPVEEPVEEVEAEAQVEERKAEKESNSMDNNISLTIAKAVCILAKN